MNVPIEVLESAIKASRKFGQPIAIVNDGTELRITSDLKPTFTKGGKRLILSNGPAKHRDILWSAYATKKDDEIIWTIPQ